MSVSKILEGNVGLFMLSLHPCSATWLQTGPVWWRVRCVSMGRRAPPARRRRPTWPCRPAAPPVGTVVPVCWADVSVVEIPSTTETLAWRTCGISSAVLAMLLVLWRVRGAKSPAWVTAPPWRTAPSVWPTGRHVWPLLWELSKLKFSFSQYGHWHQKIGSKYLKNWNKWTSKFFYYSLFFSAL